MLLVTRRIDIRNLNTLTGAKIKLASVSKSGSRTKVPLIKLNKRSKKRFTRWGIVASNFAIIGIVGFVAARTNDADPASIQAAQSISAVSTESAPKPLDNISSADVAVNVARMVGMDQSTAVVNHADSVKAQLKVVKSEESVIAKPQIVGAGLKSKEDITSYKVKEGDTVQSIAKKFNVTPDTIRLSNGLSGDAVDPGSEVLISPVNGIVYTVQDGDTPDSIAEKYFADRQSLLVFNDAEETKSFKVGERIVIPDGVAPAEPAPATPVYSEPATTTAVTTGYSLAFGTTPQYGANGYDYGWCTWHAANRRMESGNPIPSNLGNAITWLGAAQSAGLPTGSVPRAGAVLYHYDIGGLGHVAYVEKVNPDGSYLVSDMNYPIWGTVTYRTISPSETGNYGFIY